MVGVVNGGCHDQERFSPDAPAYRRLGLQQEGPSRSLSSVGTGRGERLLEAWQSGRLHRALNPADWSGLVGSNPTASARQRVRIVHEWAATRYFFDQRVAAAFLAIADRSFADIFSARA